MTGTDGGTAATLQDPPEALEIDAPDDEEAAGAEFVVEWQVAEAMNISGGENQILFD